MGCVVADFRALESGVAGTTWFGAVAYSIGLCAISWAFFVRARGRVTFWV